MSTEKEADYIIGNTLIELKIIEDDGLDKTIRQKKLYDFYKDIIPDEKEIIVDLNKFQGKQKSQLRNIIEGPIQEAIKKANKQLKNSREIHKDTDISVLFIVNNNYMSITHEQFKEVLLNRVKNDTSSIDFVIFASIYYYLDGTHGQFELKFEPVTITGKSPHLNNLDKYWHDHFHKLFITLEDSDSRRTKEPIKEKKFSYNDVTFTVPLPKESEIRGRFDSLHLSEIKTDDSIMTIFGMAHPLISQHEWPLFVDKGAIPENFNNSFSCWQAAERKKREAQSWLCPLVTLSVTFGEWVSWCTKRETQGSIIEYVNELFVSQLKYICSSARNKSNCILILPRYIHVMQMYNSTIIMRVSELTDGTTNSSLLAMLYDLNKKDAITLASAYAVKDNIKYILYG